MKQTLKLSVSDKQELVGFVKSLGTGSQFITLVLETEVGMVKKHRVTKEPNPFLGAVKRSRCNGLINVDWITACRKRKAELEGTLFKDTVYEAGDVYYQHVQTDDGKPLAICVHKKDASRLYLQYFPLKTIGAIEYYLNGKKLAAAEMEAMKDYLNAKAESTFKPIVNAPMLDSIRQITARSVQIRNDTFSRIIGKLAQFQNVPVPTAAPATVPV